MGTSLGGFELNHGCAMIRVPCSK